MSEANVFTDSSMLHRFAAPGSAVQIIKNTVPAPAVTVIVPCFNSAQYVRRCAESVLSQSLHNIELLLIDDGSKDDTPNILKQIAAEDTRVSVFAGPNCGPGTARNTGIDAARGEYIYFMDSDDFLSDAAGLETLYENASREKLDLLYCGSDAFFDDPALEKEFPTFGVKYRPAGIPGIMSGRRLLVAEREKKHYYPMVYLFLLRRAFLVESSVRFPDNLLYEDNLFALKCFLSAERAAETQDSFYARRVHVGSIVTGKRNVDHFWGYRCTYDQMLLLAETPGLAADERTAICYMLGRHLRNAADIYLKDLTEAEKQWLGEVLPLRWLTMLTGAEPAMQAIKERDEVLRSPVYRAGLRFTRLPSAAKNFVLGLLKK